MFKKSDNAQEFLSGFNGAALGRARRSQPAGDPERPPAGLQRGRARESAEMRKRHVATQRDVFWLQRGRARESAEIKCPAESRDVASLASTGPRSGERGDFPRRSGGCGDSSRFNGAALGRARRCDRWQRAPGPRQRFNGAALGRARRWK